MGTLNLSWSAWHCQVLREGHTWAASGACWALRDKGVTLPRATGWPLRVLQRHTRPTSACSAPEAGLTEAAASQEVASKARLIDWQLSATAGALGLPTGQVLGTRHPAHNHSRCCRVGTGWIAKYSQLKSSPYGLCSLKCSPCGLYTLKNMSIKETLRKNSF